MKPARLIMPALFAAIAASIAGQAQTVTTPATGDKALVDKPPVEIVSHRIGVEYYPMLDRQGMVGQPMTAETGDIPRTPSEPNVRRDRSRSSLPPEVNSASRRLRRYPRFTTLPQLSQVVLKNTGAKPIKVVEWDFLFPHCENGQFVPRYDVTTRVKIKPGGQKTLKRRLPPSASRCEMPKVISIDEVQKHERISIKRIEYLDGSVWQRQ
ncbi:MAG TPA: hypothetical protein VJZ77_16935 [Blastocatellia bacterium]|nr:hypothetical protein [Blastocatellia bacterium]